MTEPSPQPPSGPPPSAGTSRRWFLAGGAAVLLGAGAGVLGEVLGEDEPAGPAAPPEPLVAAIAAERALLADLAATTGGDRAVRRAIEQIRADHEKHLAALRKVLAGVTQSPAPRATAAQGQPRTRRQLSDAERAAAGLAAQHAAALDGPSAALLASISACEATHAELLR
jgi:hypothetical protein